MSRRIHFPKIFFFIITFLVLVGFSSNISVSAPTELSAYETAKDNFKKGFVYFNRMHYLAAVEFFRKAVSLYPEYYTAREFLARSYRLAGFISEAKKEWENLAEMTSNNVSVKNKLDAIEYWESGGLQEKLSIGHQEYFFSNSYNPLNLGRYRFSKPIDIAIDTDRNIYITSFSSGKLVQLDPNGSGISVFDLGADARLYGVDWFGGRICVSDFKNDKIHILGKNNKSFGSSGNGIGQFHGPEGVCFDQNGNIYVVDSGNSRVQKFDSNGEFILAFGKPGEYEADFNNPSYIDIDKDTVYVTDNGNKRIACFDESGNFIKNINIEGLENPRGISAHNNDLLISDEKKGLLFYSIESGSSSWFDSWNKQQNSFSRLVSSRLDRDGVLYCIDFNLETVLIFSPVQRLYSNLDIETTAIDTGKYPVIAFYMNVRNRDGSPVYNLKNENFSVVEDNAQIANFSIDYLKNNALSASFVLCVDRSDKNSGYHNEIPWVSDFVLKRMKKNDSVQLLNFNKDSWIENDFDWSRRRTINELRKRSYSNGKAVDKALYNAISSLIPKINKRGVVLVTDGSLGSDSFEKYTPEIIIEYAKAHYIPVYIIVFKVKDPVLARIAKETGGAIFAANELDGLRGIYDKVRDSEEYRYVLVYSTNKSQPMKEWWSDVKIEINDKGHRGVEWIGYFPPK